jgi:hypothetical protein
MEVEAGIGNYKLRYNKQWKPKSERFRHAYVTRDMEREPILQMESNKMIPRHVSENPFRIRFPDRSDWNKGFQSDKKGGLIWYTDGSCGRACSRQLAAMSFRTRMTLFLLFLTLLCAELDRPTFFESIRHRGL